MAHADDRHLGQLQGVRRDADDIRLRRDAVSADAEACGGGRKKAPAVVASSGLIPRSIAKRCVPKDGGGPYISRRAPAERPRHEAECGLDRGHYFPHSSLVAIRAPSASASSFAHTIEG